MVVIGPPGGSCGFGVRGVALVDCDESQPSNVVFAFECAGSVTRCARLISHETGHSFGLSHVNGGCDLMSAAAPYCEEAAFYDEDRPVVEPGCGEAQQNSVRTLLGRFGPGRADGDAHGDGAGGCTFGGSYATTLPAGGSPRTTAGGRAGPLLVLGACWWAARRRRRPARRDGL